MRSGTPSALTVVRVARGARRPDDTAFRAALVLDRERLRLPTAGPCDDMTIAGPYAIIVDGQELDEYVVWER